MKILKVGTPQKDVMYQARCFNCACEFECRSDEVMWEEAHYEQVVDGYSFWRHRPIFKQVWVEEKPLVLCPNCRRVVKERLKKKCDC